MNLPIFFLILFILLVIASARPSSKQASKLLLYYLSLSIILVLLILTIFSVLRKKSDLESLVTSIFECGFSSYYFSRFSFSIHYFSVALVFLFLDLELCYLLPFFNSGMSDLRFITIFWLFLLILTLGLLEEWTFGILDWKT